MKKIISVILSTVLFVTSICGLSGCSNKNTSGVTRAEWIKALGIQFGMDESTSPKAYYSDVDSQNPSYKYIQACVDWGVIENKDSSSFQPDDDARTDFAIETALKAAEVPLGNKTAVEYAVGQGILKDSGYSSVHEKLTKKKADEILEWSHTLYLSKTPEYHEDVAINDAVKDFSKSTDDIKAVPGDTSNGMSGDTFNDTSSDISNDISEGTYRLTGQAAKGVAEGDVLVLPGGKMNPAGVARKVTAVKANADGSKTIQTKEPRMEEVYEHVDISTIAVPKVEDVRVAKGVQLVGGARSQRAPAHSTEASNLVARNVGTTSAQPIAAKGANFSLDVNFTKGEVNTSASWERMCELGENLKISGEKTSSLAPSSTAGGWFEKTSVLPDRKLFGQDPYDNTKAINAYKAGDISLEELKKKLDLTKDGHEKKVSAMTNKFQGGYEIKGSLSISNLYVEPDIRLEKILNVPTGIKKMELIVNCDVESSLSLKGKFTEELTICTCPVVGPGGISVDIQLVLFAKGNGEVSVKAVTNNRTIVKYAHGSFRKTGKKDSSVSAEASVVIDFGPGVKANLRLFGIKVVGADMTCAVRIKAQGSGELSTSYSETENKLIVERETSYKYGIDCYVPILSVEIGGGLAGNLGISDSWTVIGEKNAAHFKLIPEKKVLVWKEVQELDKHDEKEQQEDEQAKDGYLSLNTYYVALESGESKNLKLIKIPKGYTKSELQWSSSNPSVVQVANGKLTAKKSGTVTISVKTKDGKYEAQCAVSVGMDKVDFTPLEGVDM